MYTDPGNNIYTKTEDKWGLENLVLSCLDIEYF